LALLYESLRTLKAAKSVDTANFSQQLKKAAESARIVRELVWSELPEASWQDREELDVLSEKIQKILDARTLQQLRARLLALATELERGTIVHRRAHRLSELNQLRDQAVNELRSQAGLEGAPHTVPGPQADQWIEWACGLKEPQDAESLQILRDGFAHLDDFVANLESNMWIAAGSPTPETLLELDKSAHKAPEQSRLGTSGFKEPLAPSGRDLAMRVGSDSKPRRVARLVSVRRPQDAAASSDTAAVQSKVPVLSEALGVPLAALDDSLALLYESLGELKAAKSVDIAEVIEQLKKAVESARIVRELVWSELPEASWQNRDELDALMEKIQEILDARTLEHLRARLLALATELERGTIVHRRAHRLSELNQLRDQAVNELRSQASSEGAPQTLPGPQADQWIEWACGLKEPQDAESLQTLRNGFAHLDDFVANLESNMWIAAGSPTPETLPEPERSADKIQPERSRLETKGFEATNLPPRPVQVELEAAKSLAGRDEPRLPDLLEGLAVPALESNTLTPNDVTPPRTEEEIQRMLAQEQALLASMMGLVKDPTLYFNPSAERPSPPEAMRETSATPASPIPDPVGHFNAPTEAPFPEEVFRETSTPVITPDTRTATKEPRDGKGRLLLVIIAVLALAALAAIQWRSRSNPTGNGAVKASENRVPDLTRTNPENNGHDQSGISTVAATHTSNPMTQIKEQSNPQDQSVASKPPSKTAPAKPASKRDDEVLRPPAPISRNIAMVKKEGSPTNGTAEMPGSIPGALPNAAPNIVASIATDIPVAVSKVAPQKVRVSSGVAQGLLVHQVTPKYPSLARQARVQGTVVLQAVIGKDGTVQNLHVLSGHPMLTQAAMDAVRQWRYKPYYVNGEPVEADTQINVNFTLSGG
jgi:protein TonB